MVKVSQLPQIPSDRSVYDLACERLTVILDHFDQVYVGFSGGKDSTAVLNLTLQVIEHTPRFRRHLPLRAVHADEECIPYQTEEYVRRVSERDDITLDWLCIPFKLRNACSRRHPHWWTWAPEARDKWARPLPPEAITELPGFPVWPASARLSYPDSNHLVAGPERGNVCNLMGIRAQESLQRRRIVALPGREYNYIVKVANALNCGSNPYGNLFKGYPIYDWRTEDVWTAPAHFGWDYNRAYDLMSMAGVGHSSQRCSPAFGEEPIGALWQYAQCFPEVWAKMTDRVPGVGAAYRYARTELYGYGARPAKPDGMPWQEFIRHFIGKHDPKIIGLVADRVADIIRRHYRATTHPILPKNRHPISGVSWDYLLTIAMRGDFKERKQAVTPHSDDAEKMRLWWHRYADELSAVTAAGSAGELGHPHPIPARPAALIPEEYR